MSKSKKKREKQRKNEFSKCKLKNSKKGVDKAVSI